MSTVTFENVCRAHTKRQVKIKMNKFNMFITAVCVLFLIKLHVFLASFHQRAQVAEVIITRIIQFYNVVLESIFVSF